MESDRLNIIHNWRQVYQPTPDGRNRHQNGQSSPDREHSEHHDKEPPSHDPVTHPKDEEHKVDMTV